MREKKKPLVEVELVLLIFVLVALTDVKLVVLAVTRLLVVANRLATAKLVPVAFANIVEPLSVFVPDVVKFPVMLVVPVIVVLANVLVPVTFNVLLNTAAEVNVFAPAIV